MYACASNRFGTPLPRSRKGVATGSQIERKELAVHNLHNNNITHNLHRQEWLTLPPPLPIPLPAAAFALGPGRVLDIDHASTGMQRLRYVFKLWHRLDTKIDGEADNLVVFLV